MISVVSNLRTDFQANTRAWRSQIFRDVSPYHLVRKYNARLRFQSSKPSNT